MNRRLRAFAALSVAAAVAATGGWYWQRAGTLRSTENAYVNADVVQVTSSLSGPVRGVHVREGQFVQAGQPLFDIDPEPYEVALARARAKLIQAEQDARESRIDVSAHDAAVRRTVADLANANAAARRTHSLVVQKFLAHQAQDDAQARVEVAEAALAQARAKLAGAKMRVARAGDATPAVLAAHAEVAQAELDLGRTRIVAARNGWIVNLSLVPGTSVLAHMPLFALVAQGSFWVDANFKETELPGIEPGQPAEVEIDMLPGRRYRGVVDVIEGGTGAAFSLLPAQNATGNWVKVAQRIPVRIRLADEHGDHAFRVGASCRVTVRIRN